MCSVGEHLFSFAVYKIIAAFIWGKHLLLPFYNGYLWKTCINKLFN